jgi:uncharacterized protein (TIRG00374 family)
MRFGWRGALGILLSAGFLYFAFRGIELGTVVSNVRQADVGLLLLSAVAATGIFPLRAIRWRPILDPVLPDIPYSKLWSATAIGMMINNVVPARAGEIARAYALSRSTPALPFPAAFASLAVDRLFDAVILLLLMFLAMLDPAFPSGAQIYGRPVASYAMGGVVLTLALIVALYLIILFPARVLALYEAIARRVAPRFEERGRNALIALSNGLSVLKSPSRFAIVLAWTLAHWLLNALAFWIGFKAVGIAAPFSAALFLQGLIAIGVAVPQAPGFFGVFETLGKLGLGLYGVAPGPAVTWAIGFHALSYVPITVIGAWYFLRAGLSMGDIGSAERAAATTDADPPASALAPRP